MNVAEFEDAYPELAFDFSEPIGSQARIYDLAVLTGLSEELVANFAYRSGGRGRPNRNQTKAHSQCATCKRVLRNDQFYTPPSLALRNVIFSHCKICSQEHNAERYDTNISTIRNLQNTLWTYLAPSCTICNFAQHYSAIDLHSLSQAVDEANIAQLVNDFLQSRKPHKAEKLLAEARQCIPLCSNCHRMLHAQAISLPPTIARINYRLAELIKLVKSESLNLSISQSHKII